jgi:hypothetical protein
MAWQPLTFRGVANFAHANGRRLLVVQLTLALMSGAVLVWFCEIAVAPIVRAFISQMPEQCGIAEGQLVWKGLTPIRLGEDAFLGVVVDLDRTGHFGQSSDFLVELSRTQLQVSSLLGRYPLPYPKSWLLDLDPASLRPRWEAWQPVIYIGIGLTWSIILLVVWNVLALVYCPAALILGLLMHRQITWGGSFRLSAAAMLPGALFLDMAMVLYAFRQMELIGFLVAFGLHMILGWVYLLLAPSCLPACEVAGAKEGENPFSAQPD